MEKFRKQTFNADACPTGADVAGSHLEAGRYRIFGGKNSETGYEKACEVVADTVRGETQKQDIYRDQKTSKMGNCTGTKLFSAEKRYHQ